MSINDRKAFLKVFRNAFYNIGNFLQICLESIPKFFNFYICDGEEVWLRNIYRIGA